MSGPTWPVAKFKEPPPVLWSASNRVSHTISSRFFKYHYTWCTPVFDSGALGRYDVGASQPPSSNPYSIYRNLHAAVANKDKHDDAIRRQRDSLSKAISSLLASKKIDDEDAANATAYLSAVEVFHWVPLIYVIPFQPIAGRVLAVPIAERASHEPEYLLPDLVKGEFDVIEPWPC